MADKSSIRSLVLALLALDLALGAFYLSQFRTADQLAKTCRTAQAEVFSVDSTLDTRGRPRHRIHYSFRADQQFYSGSSERWGRKGETFPVYYSPAEPTFHTTEDPQVERSDALFSLQLVGGCFAFLLAVAIFSARPPAR
ncbi:MAG: DUF3592 domain-containing protein [Vulcanimicrobiota bacterium]